MKKQFLTLLRRHALGHKRFSRQINNLATFYSGFYANANHDPSTNGEYWLLEKLSGYGKFNLIDVGAYVGEYSSYFLRNNLDSICIAIEPSPVSFSRLKDNLEEFAKVDRVHAFNVASSSSEGERTFYFYSEHPNGSTLSASYVSNCLDSQACQSFSVKALPLDSLIASLRIPDQSFGFLKIDVEGHEKEVLLGASSIINAIGAIQIEYGIHNLYENFLIKDLYHMWGDKFHIARIMPDSLCISDSYDPCWEDFKGRNLLLINKSGSAHPLASWILSHLPIN